MHYCHNCHRLTAGEALFCSHCGRSYRAKLCPSLHVNPRDAQVCASCGSRDLSVPEPPSSFGGWVLDLVLHSGSRFLLWALGAVLLIGLLQTLFLNPQLLFAVICMGLLLWWAFESLPEFVRRRLRFGRRGQGRGHGH